MISVVCFCDDCKWCAQNGECNRGAITINKGYECDCYERYNDSYTASYWIVCGKDGKKYRKLRSKGKKIEYNGYVFYTDNKTTADESYLLTEERTGYGVGEFRHLKDRWEKFVEIAASLPDVSTYPIYESEDTE